MDVEGIEVVEAYLLGPHVEDEDLGFSAEGSVQLSCRLLGVGLDFEWERLTFKNLLDLLLLDLLALLVVLLLFLYYLGLSIYDLSPVTICLL